MKEIFTQDLIGEGNTLIDENQDFLDMLNREAEKKITIEEYYNDSMTLFVLDEELYLYRTKEYTKNGYISVRATMYKSNDIDKIYKKVRDKRVAIDVEDIKDIFTENGLL